MISTHRKPLKFTENWTILVYFSAFLEVIFSRPINFCGPNKTPWGSISLDTQIEPPRGVLFGGGSKRPYTVPDPTRPDSKFAQTRPDPTRSKTQTRPDPTTRFFSKIRPDPTRPDLKILQTRPDPTRFQKIRTRFDPIQQKKFPDPI